jgi:hypothetical protein
LGHLLAQKQPYVLELAQRHPPRIGCDSYVALVDDHAAKQPLSCSKSSVREELAAVFAYVVRADKDNRG